jgi:hypothetical protein
MTVSRVLNGRGEIGRRSSPWRFPPWKRRDDTYFICAENLAVDRPKPEPSVARGLGVVIIDRSRNVELIAT